jgi:hypothetical protein
VLVAAPAAPNSPARAEFARVRTGRADSAETPSIPARLCFAQNNRQLTAQRSRVRKRLHLTA